MSADNGIYIIKFPGGYRVIEALGDVEQPFNKHLKNQLKKCKLLTSEDEANKEAKRLYDLLCNDYFPILEHGICNIEVKEDI